MTTEIENFIEGRGTQIRKYGHFELKVNFDLVSIIIRSFNGERFISTALQSILDNQWKPLEIIILYDRSTKDDVYIQIKKFIEYHISDENLIIKLIAHDKMSPFRSLMVGLENIEKESKYTFFLDYDNIFYENKIKEQVTYMKKNNLQFTFTNQYIIDENGKISNLFLEKLLKIDFKQELRGNMVDINSLCISNESLPLLLRYINTLREGTYDWIFEDWLIGMIFFGVLGTKNAFIDLPLSGYRVHSGNITNNMVSKTPLKTLKNIERLMLTYLGFLNIVTENPNDFKGLRIKKKLNYFCYISIEASYINSTGGIIEYGLLIRQIRKILRLLIAKTK